jgi:hypothetical protein
MDEMRMVRELYDPPAPPSPSEVAVARALVRPSRQRWALPSVGLGVVAARGAVPRALAGTSSPPPRPSSARTVLLAAALRADRQPATSGTYWHVASRIRWVQKVRAGGYLILSTSRGEYRQSAGTAVGRVQYLGARPATPADRAAWRNVGSPSHFLTVEGKRTTTRPEKVSVERGDQALAGMGVAAQAGLERLREIPADPARLRTWLLGLPDSPAQRGPVHVPPKGGTPIPQPPVRPSEPQIDHWLFSQGASLILYSPISAKARGAAFRMLAALPGVKLIGTVRDADGRTGTAVAMDDIDPGDKPENIQHRLVIDPANGRALADEEVVLGSNVIYPDLPAGTIAATTTVGSAGWVN